MSNRSTLLLEHHLKELRLPTFLREYRKLAVSKTSINVRLTDQGKCHLSNLPR